MGDINVDGDRRGFRYQDTSHSSSRNCVVDVHGYCRGRYSSQNIHSLSHHLGDHGRFLHLYGAPHCVHEKFMTMK